MLHLSIGDCKPKKVNGKYVTSEYSAVLIDRIVKELIHVEMTYKKKYGDLVIFPDDASKKYWRNEFFPHYKKSRSKTREESDVDFKEVFAHLNELTHVLREHFPWKVVQVSGAEADDTISIIAKHHRSERHLVYSPDKDFFQLKKYPDIDQYSPLTKKWISDEEISLEEWAIEHVCLGDSSDGVPKIVDGTEFSDAFKAHLKSFGISELTPYEFKRAEKTDAHKKALETFDVWKTNRKGEPTELDVYKTMRFGVSNLKKCINEHGSLDKWLDSHPLYRQNYERNRKLVLEECIPENIRLETLKAFNESKALYNKNGVDEYLRKHGLFDVSLHLSKILIDKQKVELSVENCGWL